MEVTVKLPNEDIEDEDVVVVELVPKTWCNDLGRKEPNMVVRAVVVVVLEVSKAVMVLSVWCYLYLCCVVLLCSLGRYKRRKWLVRM